MRAAQRILLAAFAVFAAATAFLQFRYGMICGRTDYTTKQDDPKARNCRRQAGITASIALVCLVICILLGMAAK